jgi:hypothetical protein
MHDLFISMSVPSLEILAHKLLLILRGMFWDEKGFLCRGEMNKCEDKENCIIRRFIATYI